ncbi:MAG TPA: hypothetical protein VI837_08065 [Blastocatellia bacterium]|nr:hypothetical protein [Blastocatellia bacterium]
MSLNELIALCDRLDATLQAIRRTRRIAPPMIRCPKCGAYGRARQPRLSVRATVLALSRFEVAPDEDVKGLEKSWKKYRRDRHLDLYGKPEATDTASDHPCSTANLPRD